MRNDTLHRVVPFFFYSDCQRCRQRCRHLGESHRPAQVRVAKDVLIDHHGTCFLLLKEPSIPLPAPIYKHPMRASVFFAAAFAIIGAVDLSGSQVEAKGLSNRSPSHQLVVPHAHLAKRASCKAKKSARKGSSKKHSTSSRKNSSATHRAAAVVPTTTTRKAAATREAAVEASQSSTTSSSKASQSTSSAASSTASSGTSITKGAAPPKSPWGSCFDLTATAFQPNWKGEATTTWCGVEFDKSSPILALPLADLSKAYGSNTPVTYYSNQALWKQMISDWCGREVTLQGPSGEVKAYFGDANTWSSVDLNMNVFTKLKGVATGSYSDPDIAGWMNGIKGCFSGEQISIKNGYPFKY